MIRREIKGKIIHIYTSYQQVEGGGSRNCIDWIMDSHNRADKVVIEMPKASDKLIAKVRKYANKIAEKLLYIEVEVVTEYKD